MFLSGFKELIWNIRRIFSICLLGSEIDYIATWKKRICYFTYRNIDDVLSINKPDFENYLGQLYPAELEIKDTAESITPASYLDLLLSIGRDRQLRIPLFNK